MGRAYAEFVDAMGQRTKVSTVDAKSLNDIKTYAKAIKKYSDAAIAGYGYSTLEYESDPKPSTGSNVDFKGIVIARDTRGVSYEITILSLKSGHVTKTDNGERLNKDVVDDVASAYGKLINKSLQGLYGYPVQKK